MSCKGCEEAKQGLILLRKVGLTKVNVTCNICNVIWKLKEEKE